MLKMNIFVVDIGGTSIKMCLTNEKGEMKQVQEIPTFIQGQCGGKYIVQQVIEKISEVKQLSGIGISTAGQVDSKEGTIIYANENIPNYTGTAWKQLLEARFQVPVAVENDVNCAAIGERVFGAGTDYDSFLCLTYGTGIGGAIIAQGEVMKGSTGIAAEFGHMITHGNGRACNCGGSGCYERYASTTALIKQAQIIDGTISNGKDLFVKINQGNEGLVKVVDEWIEEITYGLLTLTHIFNPECIIIGGGVMERDDVISKVNHRFAQAVMPSFQTVKIKKAKLGNQAGLMGALVLIREKIE